MTVTTVLAMGGTTHIVRNAYELEATRDALRAAGRGARRVLLRADKPIHLTRPFTLDARDSGNFGSPITYETHPDDVARNRFARISGGLRVPPDAFKPATVPSGAAGVLVADLVAIGLNLSSLGSLASPYPTAKLELFYGGRPMTLARDPNIDNDSLSTWKWVGYENATRVDDLALDLADSRVDRWRSALNGSGELWLHAYTKYDWRDAYLRVASIKPNATNSSLYTLRRDPSTTPQYPWISGCRFYAVDNLALLDAPGEYYVSATGALYFMPPPLAAAHKASGDASTLLVDDVLVSVLDTVLSVDGAKHIRFANLTIEASRGDLVKFVGDDLLVSGVTARNAGGSCVSLSGSNNSIKQSVIYGCGRSGVHLSGGDVKALSRANSSVIGVHVSNFSRIVRTYMPAVGFQGVGLYVSNNTLLHGPHCAIQGGGSLIRLHENHATPLRRLTWGRRPPRLIPRAQPRLRLQH